MKRKVIQIANSTQLVSLPRKWAKKHNIKKGEELDVEEQGNKIVISAKNTKNASHRIELDFAGLAPLLKRALHALYKVGYDDVILRYDNPELIKEIQKSLGAETLGYEIIDQRPTSCTIKTVAGGFESEFDAMLRRTFLMLKSMFESTIETLESENFLQVGTIVALEVTNNKYTGFCRRIINKNGLQESGTSHLVYCTIEELEKIADECKYLCQYLNKMSKKIGKIPKDVKRLYREVAELFNDAYTLYYTFDTKKSLETFNKRKRIVMEIQELFNDKKVNSKLLHHLLVITQKISNILSFELELYFIRKYRQDV